MRTMSRLYGCRSSNRYAGEQYPDVDEGLAMCVLREYCRSAHPEASDDPTSGSIAVTRNRIGDAADPSCPQSYGLGVNPIILLKANVGKAPHCGLAPGRPGDASKGRPLAAISRSVQ